MPRPEPPHEAGLPLAFEGLGFEVGGKPLLMEVCCRIEAGGISVLLGPNGAGKSLWLGLAAGLREPSSGRVRWLGPGAAAGPRCAIVRQRPVLLRRSVRANLAYPLRLRGVPRDAARVRIERALVTARLAELAERPARSLSVGEQQRVAIARAAVLAPEVLFLDEPAASLDPGASAALEALVRGLATEGTKIVLATHDLAQARRMANDVLFLHRGRLLEHTPAEAFFRAPQSGEAQKFLSGEILA